jgi:hypothetical protein
MESVMSRSSTLLAVCFLCASAFGQSFECYAPGPLPSDPALSCEGVVSNNLGGTVISNSVSCSFPTHGVNYLSMNANGPISVPVGGPFPRPASTNVTEVRVPIPAGSTLVSMDWEFFNRECPGAPQSFYDGMSIDVVDAAGNLLLNLAFADTASTESVCLLPGSDYCGGPISEITPAGPNPISAALPLLAGCEYLSIVVWNGGDNGVASAGYVDNIQFNSSLSACPVPCFSVPPGPPAIAFNSPGGAGCLQVTLSNLPSGGFFFMAATLQLGNFPNGWFFGIDITFAELQAEIDAGFPFIGPISTSTCGTVGNGTVGQFCGLPSGLTLYAVGLGVPFGASYPTHITNAGSYTIP